MRRKRIFWSGERVAGLKRCCRRTCMWKSVSMREVGELKKLGSERGFV